MGKKKFNISDAQTADECDGITKGEYCKDCGCPNEICCKKDGKRLGALGELELMYKYVSTTSNGGRKHLLKKIKERLIEFEEAKE